MAMRRTEGLVKKMEAGSALEEYQLVKMGSTDDAVIPCDDDDELHVGVTLQSAASGQMVDVQLSGIAEVTYGAAVVRGALLSSDASGHAITAVNTGYAIGWATVSGADGDVGCVLIDRTNVDAI